MTTATNSNATQPTHRLYCILGEGKSAHWMEIGAAWPNKDGKGFSLALHALPLTNRIAMRTRSEKAARDESQPE
jgi:hypothetical protein